MFPFSPGFYSPGFSSLMGFLLSWFLFFLVSLILQLIFSLGLLLSLFISLLYYTLLVFLSSVFSTLPVSIFSCFFLFWVLFSPKFPFPLVSRLFCCFQIFFPHEFCFSYALLFFLSIRSILRFQFSFDFRTGNLERFILLLQ